MKTCRSLVSGTPAKTSWRATPFPQSITYATSFETMTCADAELTFRGRGPPPVPRRMSFVFAPCAAARRGSHAAAANAAAPAMNARRLCSGMLGLQLLLVGNQVPVGVANDEPSRSPMRFFRRNDDRPRSGQLLIPAI